MCKSCISCLPNNFCKNFSCIYSILLQIFQTSFDRSKKVTFFFVFVQKIILTNSCRSGRFPPACYVWIGLKFPMCKERTPINTLRVLFSFSYNFPTVLVSSLPISLYPSSLKLKPVNHTWQVILATGSHIHECYVTLRVADWWWSLSTKKNNVKRISELQMGALGNL